MGWLRFGASQHFTGFHQVNDSRLAALDERRHRSLHDRRRIGLTDAAGDAVDEYRGHTLPHAAGGFDGWSSFDRTQHRQYRRRAEFGDRQRAKLGEDVTFEADQHIVRVTLGPRAGHPGVPVTRYCLEAVAQCLA